MKIALSAKDSRERQESIKIVEEFQRSLEVIRRYKSYEEEAVDAERPERVSRYINTVNRAGQEATRLTQLVRPYVWGKNKRKRIPKRVVHDKIYDFLMNNTDSEQTFIDQMVWLNSLMTVLDMMYGGYTFIKL